MFNPLAEEDKEAAKPSFSFYRCGRDCRPSRRRRAWGQRHATNVLEPCLEPVSILASPEFMHGIHAPCTGRMGLHRPPLTLSLITPPTLRSDPLAGFAPKALKGANGRGGGKQQG